MTKEPIMRSDDLRNQNRRRLLDTLRQEGPSTPSRLAALTGLSPASISTLSGQMAEQGILRSDRYTSELSRPLRGRPRSRLSLRPDAGHMLAVTLTIDLIRAHLVDYAGNICDSLQQSLSTRDLNADQLMQAVYLGLDTLRDRNPDMQLHHIVVGFQGQTEHATGRLLWSPVIRERALPMGQLLGDRYHVGATVHNDCRLIAHALQRHHADSLGETFATVLLGHGVGLGLILAGRAFDGTRSSAMEMGHLRYQTEGALCRCGRRGCIEAYAADYGIERSASLTPDGEAPAGRIDHQSMVTVQNAAASGEPQALKAFDTAGSAIAEGLVTVFSLFDSMPVALVGCRQDTFRLLSPSLCQRLEAHLMDDTRVDSLLHCFEEDDSLLIQGLVDTGLTIVDHLMASQSLMPDSA